MRLRPCGRLDYRPAPMPPSAKHWNDMTYEEQRQQLIDEVLYTHPMADPEEVAAEVDAFF
jgi:hypothetical protein